MSLVRVDVIRALSEHKLKAPCEVSAKAHLSGIIS